MNVKSYGDMIIIENFLGEDELLMVEKYFADVDFRFIHEGAWKRTYRTSDGNCLKGEEVFSEEQGPIKDGKCFPTGNEIDILFKKINRNIHLLEPVIGVKGIPWNIFSIRPYRYPAGTGLSWHADEGYAGAFIYYAHRKWERDWGGEMLMSKDFQAPGEGIFVEPKPNRFVAFRSGIFHTIKKVEQNAGDSHRLSLTGFFYRSDRLSI